MDNCAMESENIDGVTNHSSNEMNGKLAKTNNLFDYMEHATIHGVRYLGESQRPLAEKLFWIIIFVICAIFMGFFISQVIIKWNQRTVILVEDEKPTPIFNIPFPAVTLCPQVKLKTKYFRYKVFGKVMNETPLVWNFENDPDYFEKLELAQLVCHSETTYNFYEAFKKYNRTRITASHIELLYKVSPTKSDIFESIEYPMDCETAFGGDLPKKQENEIVPILTNEGVCFTFNVPTEIVRHESTQNDYLYYNISNYIQNWNYETGYSGVPTFPCSTCASGYISSLRYQVKSSIADLNTLCQPTNIGYKIILHSPAEYPNTFEDYIAIDHNSIARIAVVPRITTTSANLRRYEPKQRQCYFNDERRLKYFTFYNRANCKLECYANFTIQHYGCVHFALPATPNIPICGAIWQSVQNNFEMGDNAQSIIDYGNTFPGLPKRSKMNRDILSCGCLPECNSIQYEYTVEKESYDYDKLHDEIYEIFAENGTDSSFPTKIIVYFKDFQFTGKTRKQLYTFTDLVSNFGGLLGLFMGGSILSIVEILYFCVIRKYVELRALRFKKC